MIGKGEVEIGGTFLHTGIAYFVFGRARCPLHGGLKFLLFWKFYSTGSIKGRMWLGCGRILVDHWVLFFLPNIGVLCGEYSAGAGRGLNWTTGI